ncbi:hypothetical protein BRADI_4g39850v3 [Brachypodium distachyon]|nr:hypothetical protein BRADI_4g39850v3 [Brachypodium distachyon]
MDSPLPSRPFRLGSVIAVRLGNTRSCVSGYGNGHAGAPVFRFCIPSWVAFSDDGAALVGEAAKDHAAANPQAAVFGFKRLLGKTFGHEDVQRESFPYKIVYKETSSTGTGIQVAKKQLLHVEDVAAMVLAELKCRAEAFLGHKVHYAVLTVPSYFRDASRLAAFDAVTSAGLEPVRIIDEPTAAALAHGLHENEITKNVLVLHVGGGTAEATVLVHEDGVFEAIGTWHDAHLGGDDFDRRTANHFLQLIREKHSVDIGNDTAKLWKLRAECERAKKELSDRDVARVSVNSIVDGVDLFEPLTRAKFEELNHDLFGRIMSVVDKAMVGSELAEKKELVDEIVLVGGSSRMPRIQELISDYFGGRQVRIGTAAVEPDEAVVHGGALLSHPTAGGYECLGGERRQFGASTDLC